MRQRPARDLRSNPPLQGVSGPPDVRATARTDARGKAIDAAAAQLRGRAFLHDDPDADAAGVRDAVTEINAHLDADSAIGGIVRGIGKHALAHDDAVARFVEAHRAWWVGMVEVYGRTPDASRLEAALPTATRKRLDDLWRNREVAHMELLASPEG